MSDERTIDRFALARRLQDLALRIAAGKPVRIGGKSVRIPDTVSLEEEVETEDGTTEVEFEISWAAQAEKAGKPAKAKKPAKPAKAKKAATPAKTPKPA